MSTIGIEEILLGWMYAPTRKGKVYPVYQLPGETYWRWLDNGCVVYKGVYKEGWGLIYSEIWLGPPKPMSRKKQDEIRHLNSAEDLMILAAKADSNHGPWPNRIE